MLRISFRTNLVMSPNDLMQQNRYISGFLAAKIYIFRLNISCDHMCLQNLHCMNLVEQEAGLFHRHAHKIDVAMSHYINPISKQRNQHHQRVNGIYRI